MPHTLDKPITAALGKPAYIIHQGVAALALMDESAILRELERNPTYRMPSLIAIVIPRDTHTPEQLETNGYRHITDRIDMYLHITDDDRSSLVDRCGVYNEELRTAVQHISMRCQKYARANMDEQLQNSADSIRMHQTNRQIRHGNRLHVKTANDGRFVGFIALNDYDHPYEGTKKAKTHLHDTYSRIGLLCVEPSRSGESHGRDLMDAAILSTPSVPTALIAGVSDRNKGAIKFYEACGFRPGHVFSIYHKVWI